MFKPFREVIIIHCEFACRGIYVMVWILQSSKLQTSLLLWSIIHTGKEAAMKFTDGYWQIRAGMTPHYAAQVHEVEIGSDAMTVYAPAKKLQGRGDTIDRKSTRLNSSHGY